MDDEVSVAQLLEREGWDEHAPPKPGSRLRVLAVMGAVVLGCGVAAVLVRPAPNEEPQALWPEETNVIGVPGTPTGGGLPGAATVTATIADTTSVDDRASSEESSAEDGADDSSESSTPSDATSSVVRTSDPPAPTGGSSSARDDRPDPTDDPSETRSSTQPPPATTTTRPRDDCWFPLFC
ncbi:hypothetical protein SAMN05216266_102298 [Amycolatopsis marina]|uniref:Uncharacterized protein n=1 Tax=Amycolatopsis marina TaxID=490629 RepID=A0A1I0WZ99_9PSEU|nr:hypothetical protein [Amycolatopsis marina]SFA93416.1 hypothetical protein SAMN05216266_102298 [Amycolatopsis marina]